MEIIIYTKRECERCAALKSFLKELSIPYSEKDIDSDEVIQELVQSEYIIDNFCDEHQCVVTTPIVKLNSTWIHQEFFAEDGSLKKEDAKKILNL